MKSILIFGILAVVSTSAFSMDSRKCSNMLNNGMWKKYRYNGIGEAHQNALTQGSKRDGASTASSHSSSEGTTGLSDPKYYSNVSTSNTQSTSSFGECNIFAQAKDLRKDREVYMAQNKHEVMIDIARGNGEHLKVVTFYSACLPEAYSELSTRLQEHLGKTQDQDVRSICSSIDQIISQDATLQSKCAPI